MSALKSSVFIASILLLPMMSLASGKQKSQKPLQLISASEYYKLPAKDQQYYILSVRTLIVDMERMQDIEFISKSKTLTMIDLFLQEAYAAEAKYCAIGGKFRKVVGGKCPVYGNACPGNPQTFQCGKIFGGKCISIATSDDIKNLSKACYEKGGKTSELIALDYKSFKSEVEEYYKKSCPADDSKESLNKKSVNLMDGCGYILVRMAELNWHQGTEQTRRARVEKNLKNLELIAKGKHEAFNKCCATKVFTSCNKAIRNGTIGFEFENSADHKSGKKAILPIRVNKGGEVVYAEFSGEKQMFVEAHARESSRDLATVGTSYFEGMSDTRICKELPIAARSIITDYVPFGGRSAPAGQAGQ